MKRYNSWNWDQEIAFIIHVVRFLNILLTSNIFEIFEFHLMLLVLYNTRDKKLTSHFQLRELVVHKFWEWIPIHHFLNRNEKVNWDCETEIPQIEENKEYSWTKSWNWIPCNQQVYQEQINEKWQMWVIMDLISGTLSIILQQVLTMPSNTSRTNKREGQATFFLLQLPWEFHWCGSLVIKMAAIAHCVSCQLTLSYIIFPSLNEVWSICFIVEYGWINFLNT